MQFSGLRKVPQWWVMAAITAALTLAFVPVTGLCDSYTVLTVLMDMAKPKKPQVDGCQSSPCCPEGVCRGACTMSCCPMGNTECQEKKCGSCDNCCTHGCDQCAGCEEGCGKCAGCGDRCSAPVNKPNCSECNKGGNCDNCCTHGCEQCAGCEEGCGKCAGCGNRVSSAPVSKPECTGCTEDCKTALERQAKELHRLCVEHQRTIRELEAVVLDLCQEIAELRQEMHAVRHLDRPHVMIRYEERSQFAPPYELYQMPRPGDRVPTQLGSSAPFWYFVPVPSPRVFPPPPRPAAGSQDDFLRDDIED
jgi:hypothetical protein